MAGWNFGPAGSNYSSFWGGRGGGGANTGGAVTPPNPVSGSRYLGPPTPAPTNGGALNAGLQHPNTQFPLNTSSGPAFGGGPTPAPSGDTGAGGGFNATNAANSILQPGASTTPPPVTPPPVTPPPTTGTGSVWNPTAGATPPVTPPPPGTTSNPLTSGGGAPVTPVYQPPYSADPNMSGVPAGDGTGGTPTPQGSQPPMQNFDPQALQAGYTPFQMPNGQWRLIPPGGPAMNGHFLNHRIAVENAQQNRVRYNEDGTVQTNVGNYNVAGGEEAFQNSLKGMTGAQRTDALYGHVSGDSNALLRLDDAEFPALISKGQSNIEQLKASLNDPAFTSQPGWIEHVQQQIAYEQAKLDRITQVQQLRTQIGPYLQYLPKAPNGKDINWDYMASHPEWANGLPEEVKTALYGMHIGQFASNISGGH
jgi:hypothetical protein